MQPWPTSSGGNVLSIEDDRRQEQSAEDIGAANAGIVSEALPGNFGLEHVASEIHIGGKEVRSQVLKKLDAANDMKHQVQSQSRDRRH